MEISLNKRSSDREICFSPKLADKHQDKNYSISENAKQTKEFHEQLFLDRIFEAYGDCV